jgi:type VI secretion system VasD/TssJ family lipoprotein
MRGSEFLGALPSSGPFLAGLLALLLAACTPMQLDQSETASEPSPAPADEQEADPEPEALTEADRWVWVAGSESWRYRDEDTVPEVAAEAWAFGEDAITLNVRASDQLNAFDGKPHTLVLRFLQLNGRRNFQDSRKTQSGIRELLVAGSIEEMGAGVVAYEELVLRPGEVTSRVFDRTADTRFLAIVAGYYELNSDETTRIIPFPALDDSTEPRLGLLDAVTFGYFAEEKEPLPRRPGQLVIDLDLDSQGIGSVSIDAR